MTTPRAALAVLLASAVAAAGCATGGGVTSVPVVGRTVTVVAEPDEQLQGELLLVAKDRLYLRSSTGVREVPIGSVREARIKRHGFGAGKALVWAAIGGIATGGAMAASCSSVEEDNNCAAVGGVMFGLWLAIGLLVAPSFESSSRIELERPSPEELRAYARLPQGLPEGVTLEALTEAVKQAPVEIAK